MATTSSKNIKGFYRQKKNTGGITKNTPNKRSTKNAVGSDATQPSALISRGSPDLKDDFDEKENLLRQFDMNMVYGPCVGMTRVDRWERANHLGLNPPKEIEGLLKSGKFQAGSLWDGRI